MKYEYLVGYFAPRGNGNSIMTSIKPIKSGTDVKFIENDIREKLNETFVAIFSYQLIREYEDEETK